MKDCKKNRLSRYHSSCFNGGDVQYGAGGLCFLRCRIQAANTSGTGISTVASQMNITGSAANNVMNWQTFSIANGETVQFDAKTHKPGAGYF